jgi:tetratricopeptide (TPR) repeat protein
MDIVAYSRLHMDRQQQLLNDLQEAVRNTSAFNRAQFEDQLIRLPTGDGMALVFFRDPEAPVRCALELTKALRGVTDIKLRMGIHTGPVYRVADINANRNVAGGGINVAQRVMDCGEAGHILLSATEAEVLDQISAWCPMLHDLGEVEVKHGVRIHLYNLYSEEAGSPELPKKIAAQRAAESRVASDAKKRGLGPLRITSIATLLVVSLGSWFFYAHNGHALTDKDTIVLADFTNTTGDAVFDDTLRQGLSVQLEQSPFLSIISDQQIQQTLKMMGQKPDVKLTPRIARELCQRTASAVVLNGSVAEIGTQYLLTVRAVNCSNGVSLASTEAQAIDKSQVLDALGKTASEIRNKLGESLSTVQKFDTSLEQASTPSLEALQAFSMGRKTMIGKGDSAAAVPFFSRALQLDPKFAMAYASLGTAYSNLAEMGLAADNTKQAYELRGRVSDRERFYIESHYFQFGTGDLGKARRVYEIWAQTYPRDVGPRTNLATIYTLLGNYEKSLAMATEAVRISPEDSQAHADLVTAYIYLNRLDQARATALEAQSKNLDSPDLHLYLYVVAFLKDDAAGMRQQVALSASEPGQEDSLLSNEADTAAYFGHLRTAREFSRRASASAVQAEEKETAASYDVNAALREALFRNAGEARKRSQEALALSTDRDTQYGAGTALAFAGDGPRAEALADHLAEQFSEDTAVQYSYLPTIRALLALSRKDSSKAIELLQAATSYELGTAGGLYPVYVRGEAYLAARQSSEAAAEFQKILEHRGVVQNEPIGALAHLGLARAYVLQGDTAKAKVAYQNFLALWKGADPDIPILKQATAEYAKLQQLSLH